LIIEKPPGLEVLGLENGVRRTLYALQDGLLHVTLGWCIVTRTLISLHASLIPAIRKNSTDPVIRIELIN
jgi:hypothetical protein